ncbi:class 1 fructose-bisphosphatase [Helicobacter felis]|uniref:Fructose-1,6-bisphosphatase n=1 Tax=Helicobacter felis (strain ATCC 49179 / CCUG 28539 / NCTC 12436 / CS1) TaxID=936155 RepID=E7AAW1_HELFC|nr:class 1 fructose-bisphosphatase [Helicobacter felis]CBY83573.1 putative fructose-1,6-bisphosphatase [Helicobacter felis ATCC 49179]
MDSQVQHDFLKALQSIGVAVYQSIKSSDAHYTQNTNPTADLQLDLDVKVDRLIFDHLLQLASVAGVMSEEREQAHYKEEGDFLVAFDPLDGSSVVGANFLVGSIFGIYKAKDFADSNIAQKIQMGAYILYGAKLELVVAVAGKVAHYSYDEIHHTWAQKSPLTLKDKGKNIAPGGSWEFFDTSYKAFLEGFFKQGYRLRYSGSMVADVHHLLSKQGGIFCYPATKDAPQGKLRKLFEVYPLAFVIEQAGGVGLVGTSQQRLLETKLESLHAKSPCFLGSKVEMQALKA